MPKDWLFRDEATLCNVRVAGVMMQRGRLLVQREKNSVEYALPGGHVQMGEETKNALKREFREEMGIDIIVDRLLWTEECFWKWGERQAHTFTFYYLITGEIETHESFFTQMDNKNVEYGFLSPNALANARIYPTFIKKEITLIDDAPKHFVTYD